MPIIGVFRRGHIHNVQHPTGMYTVSIMSNNALPSRILCPNDRVYYRDSCNIGPGVGVAAEIASG